MPPVSSVSGHGARERRDLLNALLLLLAEYAFVLLPLVVIGAIHFLLVDGHENLFDSAEWSFGAAILFGQTIVRVAITNARSSAYPWQRATVLIALLLVLGLAPSLIVLALAISREIPGLAQHLSQEGLRMGQVVLFALGSLAFILVGTGSEYVINHRPKQS